MEMWDVETWFGKMMLLLPVKQVFLSAFLAREPNSLMAGGVKLFLSLLELVQVTNRWQQPKQPVTGLARVSSHRNLLSCSAIYAPCPQCIM